MNKIFENVGEPVLQKTQFSEQYNHRFNCNAGEMIPVFWQECVPGDKISLNSQALIRMNPMIYPILDNFRMKIRTFFVPTRLMWDKWEEFITGIEKNSIPPKEFTEKPPEWKPSIKGRKKFTLWDYFGLPIDVDPVGAYPLPWIKRAYNMIYNEYFRDENLQEIVDIDQEEVLKANWDKDYFTSALPFRQKGTAPSIPLTGTATAIFGPASKASDNTIGLSLTPNVPQSGKFEFIASKAANNRTWVLQTGTADQSKLVSETKNWLMDARGDWDNNFPLYNYLSKSNEIDLENLGTFNVSDLRDITQLQKWMERNARAGTRYIEFLKGHWKKSPSDKTLQRPEYIGGTTSNIQISEVLQTSQSDTTSPQGNLAGHGLSATEGEIGKYEAEEYGWIISIMTIAPNVSYQNGINKMLLRKSRLEQVYPEFVNLSEQAILGAEIYATEDEAENKKIWGYTGMYDEMRIRYSITSGDLRDKMDYMVMTRKFTNKPSLNSDFIKCDSSKRIFAIQDEPGFIVNIYNDCNMIRPIPFISEPGLIDHN